MMPSLEKELMIGELAAVLENSQHLFFARHDRMSVSDFSDLRRKLEKVASRALVVKNTLTKRACERVGLKADDFIKGSVLLTTGDAEPQAISKVLFDFAKDKNSFQPVGGFLDGEKYEADELKSLAALPSREALLGQVVGGLNAPVSGFVSVLNQLVQGFVIALGQIQKQKAG